jgi:hypothetical protein
VGTSNALVIFGLLDKASSPPTTPSALSATGATDATATLTWQKDPSTVASYYIERATGRHGRFTLDGTASSAETTYTDTALNPRTRYRYRISALNSRGESKASRAVSVTTSDLPVSDGLVGYWPLDDGDGMSVRTPVKNASPGRLVGEVAWTAAPSGPKSVLSLHGVGNAPSRVDISDSPSLQFKATDSFTLTFWASPIAPVSRTEVILSKARLSAAWLEVGMTPDGKWSFAGPSGAITGGLVTAGWHLVTAEQDGTANQRRLYVDAQLIGTGPAQAADGAGDLWLGGSPTGGISCSGQLADVRVYNRSLTPRDLATLSAADSAFNLLPAQ